MDPDEGDMCPDPIRDSAGLIEYGDSHVHGRIPISEHSRLHASFDQGKFCFSFLSSEPPN